MFNESLLKISKRIAIILLIAVFSISGFTSCKKRPTEPSASQTEVDPGDTGPIDPVDPVDPIEPEEPEKPTFPEDSYYNIYAPWVKWDESQAPNGWRTNVSWQDTNTLSQIWKDQIAGGKYNNDARWMIRDGANVYNDPRVGRNAHYYYFDKDFNLVHYRQRKGSLTVRKFISGIIIKYSAGRNKGTWSIGGLYETVVTRDEITSNGWESFNVFMGASHMGERNKGCLAILAMNTGYDDRWQNEFGIDHYYATDGGTKAWYNVEEYTGRNPVELDRFLNVKGNLSWLVPSSTYNFRFVFAKPYDWHLESHIEKQGWH